MTLASGVWGVFWLPQRLLLDAGMTGGWGTIAQHAISLAVLIPIAIWRVFTGHKIGLKHWACGLLLGASFIFYANSFLLTDVIRALVFFYLTPVWATLVEAIFLKRLPNWPRAASVTLALTGVWITVGLDIGVPIPSNLGDWYALVSGMLLAAAAARTEIEQPSSIFPVLFMVFLFSTITATLQYPFLISSLGAMPTVDAFITTLPFLLGLSLFVLIPTTIVLFWSPPRIGTGLFGILILSELVVGVISAALLANEVFGWREITGTTLILVAALSEIAFSRTQISPPIQASSHT